MRTQQEWGPALNAKYFTLMSFGQHRLKAMLSFFKATFNGTHAFALNFKLCRKVRAITTVDKVGVVATRCWIERRKACNK